MDLFKSVFPIEEAAEPLAAPPNPPDSDSHFQNYNPPQHDPDTDPDPDPDPSSWSFGGLIKTIATRSESVIETYRRDLGEFHSGLKKETNAFREIASLSVKDLPTSIEARASAANESLQSVGHAIDEFGSSVWRGTAGIISDALASTDDNADAAEPNPPTLNSKRYSRFGSQVLGFQSDAGTFCIEPEDLEDFKKWELGFVLEERMKEMENLIGENGALEAMYEKLVPGVVDQETFWRRYFYRIHKLNLVEDARANLVKRAISREDDEDLSWEVEDDENQEEETEAEGSKNEELEKKEVNEVSKVADAELVTESSNAASGDKGFAPDPDLDNGSDGKLKLEGKEDLGGDMPVIPVKSDEKVSSEEKLEVTEPNENSDLSLVSNQLSAPKEDDLEWDEIEDLGSIDEKKVTGTVNPNKDDVRRSLNTSDEEILTWDIEEDEPSKQ